MKIYSICLVKDEADIVGDVIKAASAWSDYIYIYDNGSTDGTTSILKDLSEIHENIIFYKWSDIKFNNSMRQEVYQEFKQNSTRGDWWCRLDADEFFIDNPRVFLQGIDDGSNAVLNSSYNFYFTERDLQQFEKNPEAFSYRDLKYYQNNCSEVRFVKDDGNLYWPPSGSWPTMVMDIYDLKIRVRHYQYRDPSQIAKRVKNRNLAYKGFDPFKKRNIGNLGSKAVLNKENRLIDHRVLNYDDGDESLVPGQKMSVWKPDNSLRNRLKVRVKNILYRLRLIDPLYNFLGKQQ